MMDDLLQLLLESVVTNPVAWAYLAFLVVTGLVALGVLSDRFKEVYLKEAIILAYDYVEEYQRRTGLKVPDKSLLFLEKLGELLAAGGIKLDDKVKARALTAADAIHLSEKRIEL